MDASAPSATPSYDPLKDDLLKNVKDRLADLKNLWTDQAIQYRMLQSIQSDLKKVSNQNQAQKGALDKELEAALAPSAGYDTDSQNKIKALKEEFARDFKKIEADKLITPPSWVAAAAPMTAPVISANWASRPEKVSSALGYTSVVWQKAQALALGELIGVDTKNPVISALEDANIPSLLSVLKNKSADDLKSYVSKYNEWGTRSEGWDIYNWLRDLGYSSNGTLGSTEAWAVKNFIEYFLSASPAIKSKLSTASDFAQAWLATTVARNSLVETDKLRDMDSVINYLSNLPDARFKASDVATVLKSLKDTPNFLARLAVLCGMQSTPTNLAEFVTDLKNNPKRKAQFFENINTAGANQNVSLRNFLLGKWAEKATETANEINKAITWKAVQAVLSAQAESASTTNPTEKEKIDAVLAEYNKKGEGWLTGEIRKVAEGAFANIGKNANTLGVGMSFETFVRGLTVNLGAGISDGKIWPAAVVHYDLASGKLTETEKKIIEWGIGVGTSVFPAVIPFINGSLKATDKLQVYGKGIGGIDSTGLSAMISKSGGVLSLNFMNERKSEIDQWVAKLNSVIADFSTLKMSDITKEKITTIISVKDKMSITPEEATYWVSRMKELYRVNGVTDTTPSEAKAILIKGLVESEGEKKYTQEAMNDTDARSYKGFSVGIGHLFGVTFPLAWLIFKEGKIEYSYPAANEVKVESSPLNVNSLFSSEKVFNERGDTYSLTLANNSPINKSNTTLENGMEWLTDEKWAVIWVKWLKDYGIKVSRSVENKYTLVYDKNVKITFSAANAWKGGVNKTDLKVENLNRINEIAKELNKAPVRQQLSNLWLGKDRKGAVNDFAQHLQNSELDKAKESFNKMTKGLWSLSSLTKSVNWLTKPEDIQSALYDIRGALMMDKNQADKFQNGVINESAANSAIRFNKMLNDSQSLLSTMWLTIQDYADLLKWGNDGIKMSEQKKWVFWAVASLKTNEKWMTRMPPGTVRYATRNGQEFVKDITAKDNTVKWNIFDTVIPKDSAADKAIIKTIQETLKLETVTHEDAKTLISTGSAKIGGRVVTMEGQKFYLFAYGDCTNPWVWLELWSVSIPPIPGKPGIPSVNISAAAESMLFDVSGATMTPTEIQSGIAWSLYGEKPKPPTKPTPGTTTPGGTPGTPNPEPENPPPGPGGGGGWGGGGNTGGWAGWTGGERPPDNPTPITTPGHTTTPNQTVNAPPVTTVTPGSTNVTVEIGAPITPLPAPTGGGNATGTSGGR